MAQQMSKYRPVSEMRGFIESGSKRVLRAEQEIALNAKRIILNEVITSVKLAHPSGKGTLANSFEVALTRGKKRMTASLESTVPYARQRDRGGVIRPRTVSMLAIPLSQEAKTNDLWPRQWPKGRLFKFRSKKGNWLLAETVRKQNRGRGGRFASGFNNSLKIHFLLKKQVEQQGSFYIDDARRRIAPQVGPMVKRIITMRLKKDFIAPTRPYANG